MCISPNTDIRLSPNRLLLFHEVASKQKSVVGLMFYLMIYISAKMLSQKYSSDVQRKNNKRTKIDSYYIEQNITHFMPFIFQFSIFSRFDRISIFLLFWFCFCFSFRNFVSHSVSKIKWFFGMFHYD